MASATAPIALPNPEVRERPTRRRFTLADKQRILTAAAACTERGVRGALLCREGWYASQLATWRQQQRDGRLAGPRGHRSVDAIAALARLRRDNARLTHDLEVAHAVLEVPKKLSVLLGVTLPPLPEPLP